MGKRILTALALTAGSFLWATGASAAFIAPGSVLSLNGSDSFTATSITFANPANIGGETGSFTSLTNCTGCAIMTSFTSGTATPFLLYTATEGAITTTLTANSDLFNFVGGPLANLTVTGAGTLTLTGFSPTPGNYILTTQGPTGVSVTFSVSSVAVPEPASLTILGASLVGLGLIRRRRRKMV